MDEEKENEYHVHKKGVKKRRIRRIIQKE